RAFDNVGVNLGVTVNDDDLVDLSFELQGKFKVFGVQFETDQGNRLYLEYSVAHSEFEMSGGLSVTVPTANDSTIDVVLGYNNGSELPGVVVSNHGELTSLNAEISGDLNLAKLQLSTAANGLNFSYDRAKEQYEVYGDVTLTVP